MKTEAKGTTTRLTFPHLSVGKAGGGMRRPRGPLRSQRKVLWAQAADPPRAVTGLGNIFTCEPKLEYTVRSASSLLTEHPSTAGTSQKEWRGRDVAGGTQGAAHVAEESEVRSAERASEGWEQTGRRDRGGGRRRERRGTQKAREKKSQRKIFHFLPPKPPSPDSLRRR